MGKQQQRADTKLPPANVWQQQRSVQHQNAVNHESNDGPEQKSGPSRIDR
jgi:hypothetical protein